MFYHVLYIFLRYLKGEVVVSIYSSFVSFKKGLVSQIENPRLFVFIMRSPYMTILNEHTNHTEHHKKNTNLKENFNYLTKLTAFETPF